MCLPNSQVPATGLNPESDVPNPTPLRFSLILSSCLRLRVVICLYRISPSKTLYAFLFSPIRIIFLYTYRTDTRPKNARHSSALFLFTYLYIYLRLYSSLLDLGRFFSFLILYTVGRTPWKEDQPVARPLPTHRTTQTQN
jgi:hypothetical protein